MILQLLQLGTVTLNYISDLHTLSNILTGILLHPLFGFSLLHFFFLRSSLINRSQGPKTHLPFSLPVFLSCTTVSFAALFSFMYCACTVSWYCRLWFSFSPVRTLTSPGSPWPILYSADHISIHKYRSPSILQFGFMSQPIIIGPKKKRVRTSPWRDPTSTLNSRHSYCMCHRCRTAVVCIHFPYVSLSVSASPLSCHNPWQTVKSFSGFTNT